MESRPPRLAGILLLLGYLFAALPVAAVLRPDWADRFAALAPIVVAHRYAQPADGVTAAFAAMLLCWAAALGARLIRPTPHRPRWLARLALGALCLVTGLLAALGAALFGILGRVDLDRLGAASDTGCRVVVRTQPWMAAAHGDFLLEVPGEHRLRQTSATWELSQGGPDLPPEQFWTIRWVGPDAALETAAPDASLRGTVRCPT